MNELARRLLLYGGGIALGGGLLIAALTSRSDADVFTLLGSVDVQLRMAGSIPSVDKDGHELTSRTKMIEDARQHLDTVERLHPGMAVAAEFRGFAHSLRGEFAEAAAEYARARSCQDCGAEQRDVLAFNEARMLAKAGRNEQALAVFATHAADIDKRWAAQRGIEEAQILRAMHRDPEAEARLDGLCAGETVEPLTMLQAGIEYELLGRLGKAETTLRRASEHAPIADYHLARLKLRAGDVDTSLQLLGRATAAVPAEVRRKVQNEPEAWRALAADPRFQELTALRAAAPGR